MKYLLRILCKTFISMIRGKSTAEIQELFIPDPNALEEILEELSMNDNKTTSHTETKKK